MGGRIVRCGIISSCQAAAISEIEKHFWSRFSIISRTGPLPLPFNTLRRRDCRINELINVNSNKARENSRVLALKTYISVSIKPTQ